MMKQRELADKCERKKERYKSRVKAQKKLKKKNLGFDYNSPEYHKYSKKMKHASKHEKIYRQEYERIKKAINYKSPEPLSCSSVSDSGSSGSSSGSDQD